jgi:homoprotocatechuate degradation regulator HpaR
MAIAKQRVASTRKSGDKLHRNLPLLLLQGREMVISHFRPILNHGGITEQQWRIIRTIYEAGPLEPNQICDSCQILSPSLAGVLARMEEMGLVNRERVDTDQRRIVVTLTDKSKALVLRLAPLIRDQYALLEKAIGSKLVTDLYSVLDRLLALKEIDVPRIELPDSVTNGKKPHRAKASNGGSRRQESYPQGGPTEAPRS